MKTILSSFALLALLSFPAEAACYADYKAKRDNPLRLHYGVIELDDAFCSGKQAARDEIQTRIGRDKWTLLNILSIFDAGGLAGKEESAGKFYLRY